MYPIFAKQYVDGAWIEKTAQSWQSGMWVKWVYSILNTTIDNTGGWKWYSSGSGPSVERQSDGSYKIIRPISAYGPGFLYMTNNSFDLTHLNTIEFEILETSGTDAHYVGIMSPHNTSPEYATARIEVTPSVDKYRLDIRSYSGEYCLAINVSAGGTLSITNIVLRC